MIETSRSNLAPPIESKRIGKWGRLEKNGLRMNC